MLRGDIDASVSEAGQAVELARAFDDIELPIYLQQLARIHALHLQHDEGLPAAREAVTLAESYFGNEHPAYARALQSMGGIQIDMGDTDAAVATLEKSLAIERRAYPAQHPKLAATWAICIPILSAMTKRNPTCSKPTACKIPWTSTSTRSC